MVRFFSVCLLAFLFVGPISAQADLYEDIRELKRSGAKGTVAPEVVERVAVGLQRYYGSYIVEPVRNFFGETVSRASDYYARLGGVQRLAPFFNESASVRSLYNRLINSYFFNRDGYAVSDSVHALNEAKVVVSDTVYLRALAKTARGATHLFGRNDFWGVALNIIGRSGTRDSEVARQVSQLLKKGRSNSWAPNAPFLVPEKAARTLAKLGVVGPEIVDNLREAMRFARARFRQSGAVYASALVKLGVRDDGYVIAELLNSLRPLPWEIWPLSSTHWSFVFDAVEGLRLLGHYDDLIEALRFVEQYGPADLQTAAKLTRTRIGEEGCGPNVATAAALK